MDVRRCNSATHLMAVFGPLVADLRHMCKCRVCPDGKCCLFVVQDLSARYGKPIIVLNLVKSAEKRPRESILQAELARAVAYINKGVRAALSIVCSNMH